MKRRNFKDLNGPNLLLMIHEGQNGRNIMPVIAQYDEFVSYESFYLEVGASKVSSGSTRRII